MPEIITKEDGTEVEVYTKEEVESQVQEKENSIDEIRNELKEAQDKVKEFENSNKGQNMAALRKGKEAAEAAVTELRSKLDEGLGEVKGLIEKDSLNRNISVLADNDEEVSKKIKFHYDSIVKDTDDDKTRKEKLGSAYQLATGNARSNVMGNLSAAGAPGISNTKNNNLSPDLISLGKKLGLTDKDIESYGK